MSGPKTTRYHLTPEQRALLLEARRRERERIACLALAAHCHGEAANVLAFSHTCRPLIEGLLAKGCDASELLSKTERLEEAAKELLDKTLLSADTPYEEAVRIGKELEEKNAALKEALDEAKRFAKEQEALLEKALEDAIDRGFETSFAALEQAPDKRRMQYAARLQGLTDEQRLPMKLLNEAKNAQLTLDKLGEEGLSTYEALTLTPLEKAAALAVKEYDACYREYTALRAEYEGVCTLRDSTPLYTECSYEGLAVLKKALEDAKAALATDDEEGYIAECLDKVMEELGYRVIGARDAQKKSGRRFHHELYTYKDGTVVDVTTADDGKITMELGAPDRVDRLPTGEETRRLCRSMEEFCSSFGEIEARLAEMGIAVKDRLSHLPPTADHAQIINVGEYDMREDLPTDQEKTGGGEGKKEGDRIRRRQKKRKVFRKDL